MTSNNKKNIILTGFMGTGKTTVGKWLAAQLGYEFIDTDEIIEQQQGRTIPEIFQEAGEAAFRQMESDLAQALANQQGLVISTGGRMMLDPANATALGRQSHVFCLVATPEEILQRLQLDTSHSRPLLAVADPEQRIVQLLAERAEGYGRFLQIQTSGKTVEEIVQEIIGIAAAQTESG